MNLTQVKALLRPEVPGCSEVLLDDAIIQGCRQFCEDTGLLRDTLTVNAVAGTGEYTLTATDSTNNEVFMIYSVNTDNRILTPLAESPENRLERTGTPSFYTFNGGKIQLLPEPEVAGVFTVEAMVRPQYKTSTSIDNRFAGYVDVVAHWAKYRLMSMLNQPWSMMDGALYNKGRYEALTGEAKWAGWRANTRAAVNVRQRPFA